MSSSTVYRCQVCGKTFASNQALGGHSTVHRGESAPPTPLVPDGFAGELFRARRELVESFRPRINELDAKIAEAQAVVDDLKAQRREVETQLRRLDPEQTPPGPKPKAKASVSWHERDTEKFNATRTFLGEHGESLGEFTAAELYRAMKAENVTPLPSPDKVRTYVPMLRDQGVLRANRKTRGGGMAWAVVSTTNGGSE